ncbi:hypothetical protein KR222_009828 [Zaprionus bogoriensis]|nr:hypothetical protein KR222_009828 [Zaprionus bogoriensis]
MRATFLIIQVLGLLWASGIAESRQIRINRYAATVEEDNPQQAEVREVKPTPYPAAGYRPEGRAFLLPGEEDKAEGSGFDADQATTTTDSPADDSTTSTTDASDWSTTALPTTTTATTALDTLEATTTAAPAAFEFRSGRAFAKAPYPPAGYRPSRAFPLPTELNLQPDAGAPQATSATTSDSNANHPVCGVSTNPLMPTPEPGSKDEPDAESVVITANLGPAVLVARAPTSLGIPMAIPLRSEPLIDAPRRGFAYTTHVERRW